MGGHSANQQRSKSEVTSAGASSPFSVTIAYISDTHHAFSRNIGGNALKEVTSIYESYNLTTVVSLLEFPVYS